MTVIGSAAPAEHGDVRKATAEIMILLAEFLRIAGIELGRIVELRVASLG